MRAKQTLERVLMDVRWSGLVSVLAMMGVVDGAEPGSADGLAPMTVVGSRAEIPRIAGSAARVETPQIRTQTYTNPGRVLQQVPGVYIRDEDGFGNLPNISLRGVDGGRSAKVTVMEDGIMMAPAPYSEPAAYYTPRIGRMSGIEVLKGSSQVRFGPHTTGGVVNYLSTPFAELDAVVPAEEVTGKGVAAKGSVGVGAVGGVMRRKDEFYLKTRYGSWNTWTNHGNWAHTQETGAGLVGWVVEMFQESTDGFRNIDRVGGSTGFTALDPNVKFFWEPDTVVKQRFEFRAGYTNFDGNETYTGLTEEDFRRDPQRRYVSTQYDRFVYDQFRSSLTHTIEPSAGTRVETTAYYTTFDRSWNKLDGVKGADGKSYTIPNALAAGGEALDVLRGDAAGTWRLRDGNREYRTMGVQTRVDTEFATGSVEHRLSVGARLHYDEAERLQTDTNIEVDERGRELSRARTAPGTAGNRKDDTVAFSLWAEDAVKIGRLTVKPGVRWEHLEQEYRDRDTTGADPDKVTASGSGSQDIVAPGVGLVYDLGGPWSVFGGYYRGFSTPSPRDALAVGLDPETSDGFEAGVRHYGDTVQVELVGFFTKFSNLIVLDNSAASGTVESDNAGDITTYGLEAALRWDPLAASGSLWRLPIRLSGTLTSAELDSDSPSADGASIFSGGRKGNDVPYIPDFTIAGGIGIERGRFGLYADATYTPAVYGTASNTTSQRNMSGVPDARFGKTDSAFVVDVTARCRLGDHATVFAGVSNVLNDEYIASRLPLGPRGGQPRMFFGGIELQF
jgi:Fe(3+) dicitrate transport protein